MKYEHIYRKIATLPSNTVGYTYDELMIEPAMLECALPLNDAKSLPVLNPDKSPVFLFRTIKRIKKDGGYVVTVVNTWSLLLIV